VPTVRDVTSGDPDGNTEVCAAGTARVIADTSGGSITGRLEVNQSDDNGVLATRSGQTWNMYVENDGSWRLYDNVNNDVAIAVDTNGGVTLRYNNTPMLSTSASGGTLTGTWNATTDLQVGGVSVALSNDAGLRSDEEIQDVVGAMVSGNTETNIVVTYQDGDGTLDFSVSGPSSMVTDFAEAVSDQVGTMVTGNTETGLSVTYQDGDNTLDFAQDWSGLSAISTAPEGTDEFLINNGGTFETMSYNESALPSNTDANAHSFADTDVGTIRYYTGTGGHTWTVGTGVGQDNCYIVIINSGSGTFTVAGSGVTINSQNSLTDVSVGGTAVLIRESSTSWFLSGALE